MNVRVGSYSRGNRAGRSPTRGFNFSIDAS